MNTIKIDTPEVEARFWEWVDKRDAVQCWEWTGYLSKGYGIFCNKQILYTAHRIAYMYHYRRFDLTKRDMIMHACENKRCCNPAHLCLMSASERHAKMVDEGLGNIERGEKNMMAKLSIKQAIEIKKRIADGEKVISIADDYPVSKSEIRNIASGLRWKWLTDLS